MSNAAAGRIVVGVDGGEPSKRALRWAARQASLTGAELQAVIAWESLTSWSWAGVMPVMPEAYVPEEVGDRALADAIEETFGGEPPVAIERRVIVGNPADVLLEAAEGAELLVVGDRGRAGFRAALLGSVSHHVTQHAPCPVVVVRGAEEGTEGATASPESAESA
ncbi:universal stress protein [Streptomyces sp. NPDC050610]|uniref:universal stress protein n=1 Tax=Streptomyces sp. NPDC050610 TaxID=3157097 RepID=UPI00341FCF1F